MVIITILDFVLNLGIFCEFSYSEEVWINIIKMAVG
jgi:hypothetical protein